MIAFEVSLNGKRVCIAGADDLGVLSTIISACGKLGKKTVSARPDEARDVHYSVGGLTSRDDSKKDVHVRWKSVAPLKIGDVIQVRVVETENVDRAKSRTRAKPKRAYHVTGANDDWRQPFLQENLIFPFRFASLLV